MVTSDDELNSNYQKIQYYLRKNAFDLNIDQVIERLHNNPSILLSASASSTECRNYWSQRCEVSHRSVRVSVDQDYASSYLDNIRSADFYVCDKLWVVNFTQYKPQIHARSEEEEELYKSNLRALKERILMSEGDIAAADAEARRVLRQANNNGHQAYLDSMSISIAAQLKPISRPLHSDSLWLAEFIVATKRRKRSLYHPELSFHLFEDNYHLPEEEDGTWY